MNERGCISGSATAICEHGGLKQEQGKQSQELRTLALCPDNCLQGFSKLQTLELLQESLLPVVQTVPEP